MLYILPEVLVTIADYADSQSIYCLMLTCRRFHQVLHYHERSVVKGKLEAYCRSAIDPRVFQNPGLGQDHPLLQLYGENDGTVLTSDAPKRIVACPFSYHIVKELEIRESRIQDLFGPNGSLLKMVKRLHHSDDLDDNSPAVTFQLDSIQRACRISDLLGDCVARIVARSDWVDGYNAHLADHHYYPRNNCRCNCWVSCLTNATRNGVVIRSRHLLDSIQSALPDSPTDCMTPVVRDQKNKDILMTKLAHTVRTAQIALISRLPVFDMLCLAKLSELAGVEYSFSIPAHMHQSDPEHIEKRTAFQESMFRRGGSLSLWAIGANECKGYPTWTYQVSDRVLCKKMAEDAVKAVHWELFLWEMGYGADRVAVAKVFEPVEDEYLTGLTRAFDEVLQGDGQDDDCEGDERDGGREEKTVPAMQRGLQPTLIRSLSRRDQKVLTAEERGFAERMRPYDGAED
ncbi:hypothetical protein BR93DRAFT_964330 [Coniochaeta sp. PMI_546]|nr:hypothetical protein BR93DRAFT_964330 [Coniochaeta sp. PMI_546]